jgi:hypothetical protein
MVILVALFDIFDDQFVPRMLRDCEAKSTKGVGNHPSAHQGTVNGIGSSGRSSLKALYHFPVANEFFRFPRSNRRPELFLESSKTGLHDRRQLNVESFYAFVFLYPRVFPFIAPSITLSRCALARKHWLAKWADQKICANKVPLNELLRKYMLPSQCNFEIQKIQPTKGEKRKVRPRTVVSLETPSLGTNKRGT